MNGIYFLLKCQVRNFIKQLLKKPLALIGYAVMITALSANSIVVLFSGGKTEDVGHGPDMYLMFTLMFVCITVLPSIYSSVSKFSLNLSMADVNFMMPGPVHPVRILVYGQIKQSATSFFVALFMVVQLPLLIKFVGMSFGGSMIFLVAWFLMLITISPICMGIFMLLNSFPVLKKTFKGVFYAYCVALGLFVGWNLYSSDGILEGAKAFLVHPALTHLPVIGWYYGLFKAALLGWNLSTTIDTLLLVATVALSALALSKFATTDYYEDAIVLSERVAKIRAAAKEGKTGLAYAFNMKSKVKKVNYHINKPKAMAIFQKQLLEQRKKGYFFLDLKSVLTIAISAVPAILIPLDGAPISSRLLIVLGIQVYILFLANSSGPMGNELQKPYIYLIPDSHIKKLFALTSWFSIKTFTDALLSLMVVAIYSKIQVYDALLAAIAMVFVAYILTFTDLTCTMLFGRVESAGLKVYIKMMINIMVLMPNIIVIIILITLKMPMTIGLVGLILSCMAMSGILMIPASRSIRNPEYQA